MRRHFLLASAMVLIVTQQSFAQDTVKELKRAVQQTAAAAARSVTEQLPAPTPGPCVELDVLIGCVAFDEKGELGVDKEGVEPDVRAGTIGVDLAAKLNEQRNKIPAGISPGAAGANFLLQGLAGEEKLEWLEQFRLRLSTDGSEAHLQSGQRSPRITGSAVRSGGMTNTISMESLGVLIGGSAQITKTGKIALALEVERSGFGPEEEGTPVAVNDGTTIRAAQLDTMTIKTQTSSADGESVLLGGQIHAADAKVTETFVVVTATLVKP